MKEEEIERLTALLNDRTMKLMERESELADRFEEIEAQKEELTAAVEELIDKNKQLVERNQELDQILYRSSHDLRSPLSSMFGILNLLKSEQLPDHLKGYCFHLEQKMQQMNSVINTLTTLGQSVLDEIKIKQVNIEELLEDEISHLSYLANFKNITFNKTIEGDRVVLIDELLTRIILRSLLSNAIIFRDPELGYIQIRISVISCKLYISIQDDGEGISEEIAAKIWDMFYRGSERSIGQGMGLYLVKKIVDRLQGTVTWRSANRITEFEVSIPIPAPLIS